MKQIIESVVLENDKGQRLRLYKVDGGNTYCIGGDADDHFEFTAREAEDICNAIGSLIDGREE
jgi:hypothetical protein